MAYKLGTKAHLLNKLDFNSFVILIGDILSIRGFTNIRVTDGPGDGGRDIHSFTPTGQKHLTQCKFHEDTSITCGSRDLSELPMAMMKLDYSTGLFATNSKISPQGKREFLDNYPQYELDFFDHKVISKEIDKNVVLTALWSDGNHYRLMKNIWVFPFIIRSHKKDLPIVPHKLEKEQLPPPNILSDDLKNKYPNLIIEFQGAHPTTEAFEPYRYPEPYADEEGAFPFLMATESLVTGITLPEIYNYQENLCKSIINWLGEKYTGISVRVGKPYITPLEGIKSGGKILTDTKPITYIKTLNSCGEERNWFSVNGDTHWDSESDARVTEAEGIRLYNPEINICLKYEIFCRMASSTKTLKVALREQTAEAWQKSHFALVPEWQTWPYPEIQEPDEKIEWKWNGKILCGWFHKQLLGGLTQFRSLSTYSNFFKEYNEKEENNRLDKVKSVLETKEDISYINPTIARHMLAITSYDPLIEIDKESHHTGDVVYYPESIPSPINPSSRLFLCEIVVIISKNEKDKIHEFILKSNGKKTNNITIEEDEEYSIINYSPEKIDLENSPTVQILFDIYKEAKHFLSELYKSKYVMKHMEICTKIYWKKRFGISLGLNWKESSLPVLWKNGKPVQNSKVEEEMGFDND